MLQDNASDNPNPPPLPLRAPEVSVDTAKLEAELTLRTQTILRAVMRQVRITKWETEIDFIIRQVCVRFAYDDRGINLLPSQWRPGFAFPHGNWWQVLKYQLIGLVTLYYEAVKEHRLAEFEVHARRLEEMIDKGIKLYLLSPAEPAGFILRTQVEWEEIVIERERRKMEIMDNKERLRAKRLDG